MFPTRCAPLWSQADQTSVRLSASVPCSPRRSNSLEQSSNTNPTLSCSSGFLGWMLEAKAPPAVDLCGVIEALVGDPGDRRTGHQLLINLANQNQMAHISDYISTKLTDDQARIVYAHLQRHPNQIARFVAGVPDPSQLALFRFGSGLASSGASIFGLGDFVQNRANAEEDRRAENSDALRLAREICDSFLNDFTNFIPRSVNDVVRLLERLQDNSASEPTTGSLLDTLRRYMYGNTPMCDALRRSLAAFRLRPETRQRVLVLVSDGEANDGNPLPVARELQQEGVSMAMVYLTSNSNIPRRRLHDRPGGNWSQGQLALFNMATKVAVATHPIPVLASVGWEVPVSGETALYASICSTEALEEFCSVLLSARFGSVDTLLDIIGRVRLDEYVNDEYMRARRNPSDQGTSATCYAHAVAAVIHMALLRIEGREGGCPSIEDIRNRILVAFPPAAGGRVAVEVLRAATGWYRPLQFRAVDEDGARQALHRRRPVLTTFRLSDSGWDHFGAHFGRTAATRTTPLLRADMANHRAGPDGGGHAVVLVGCDPRSLTFLNSWGDDWGDHGSFGVEDGGVLERTTFYDVFWVEADLTPAERKAYADKGDAQLRARAANHPSLLELEARCPCCRANMPIVDFTGSIRSAMCPRCGQLFKPEPGHLVQAIYARAGLGDVS